MKHQTAHSEALVKQSFSEMKTQLAQLDFQSKQQKDELQDLMGQVNDIGRIYKK